MKILLIIGAIILIVLYLLIGMFIDGVVIYKAVNDTWGPMVWMLWPLMIVIAPIIYLMYLFCIVGTKIVERLQDIFKV